ncbi:hypothetical protein K7T73_08515 [Bacillus badius]|uniref:hypothetical protein n=1 Tax=Bacillus badius TaxID=1455 RepID=UPI001CBB4C6E|nr:hypothetical protein [Bacillus badius]UAT32235.1 hypothetical protein K7T73_08515 [Bacillus badius]
MKKQLKKCNVCGEFKPLTEFYHRRAKCKPCFKEYSDRYAKKRIKNQNNAPNTLTDKEKERILEECGHSCVITGTKEDVVLDHFVPLALGETVYEYRVGGTTYENMLPLSSTLNKSKCSSNPITWFEKVKTKFDLDSAQWNRAMEYMAAKNEMTKLEYLNRVEACFVHFKIKKWVEQLDHAVIYSSRPLALLRRAVDRGINIKVAVIRYGSDAAKEFIRAEETATRLQEIKVELSNIESNNK